MAHSSNNKTLTLSHLALKQIPYLEKPSPPTSNPYFRVRRIFGMLVYERFRRHSRVSGTLSLLYHWVGSGRNSPLADSWLQSICCVELSDLLQQIVWLRQTLDPLMLAVVHMSNSVIRGKEATQIEHHYCIMVIGSAARVVEERNARGGLLSVLSCAWPIFLSYQVSRCLSRSQRLEHDCVEAYCYLSAQAIRSSCCDASSQALSSDVHYIRFLRYLFRSVC